MIPFEALYQPEAMKLIVKGLKKDENVLVRGGKKTHQLERSRKKNNAWVFAFNAATSETTFQHNPIPQLQCVSYKTFSSRSEL